MKFVIILRGYTAVGIDNDLLIAMEHQIAASQSQQTDSEVEAVQSLKTLRGALKDRYSRVLFLNCSADLHLQAISSWLSLFPAIAATLSLATFITLRAMQRLSLRASRGSN